MHEEQITVVRDAPVKFLPLHMLSAVIAHAGPLVGLSFLLPIVVHRTFPVIVRPDLFYGIRYARYLMINIGYYINKIG